MDSYRAKVLDIYEDVPDVFIIKLERPKNFDFKSGQFITVTKIIDGVPAVRAYSISTTPQEKKFFELCVKRIPGGKVSPFMCSLKKNQILDFKGPAGKFVIPENLNHDMILASTGTGISANKSLIRDRLENGFKNQIYLFFGVKTQSEIIYRKELEELSQKYKNFHFIPVLSREEWKGEKGHVQDPIKKYVKNLKIENIHMFVCGVPIMVEETKALAVELGFKEDHIHFERC